MYGSVMIGSLKPGVSAESVQLASKRWLEERAPHVQGYIGQQALLADDGQTIVMAVQFASKSDYTALADDPAQDAFWSETFQPLLAGEPRWIDGMWETLT
jgi:hypothetical protein